MFFNSTVRLWKCSGNIAAPCRSIVVSKEQLIEPRGTRERKKRKKALRQSTSSFFMYCIFGFVGVPPHWGLLRRTSVIKRKNQLEFCDSSDLGKNGRDRPKLHPKRWGALNTKIDFRPKIKKASKSNYIGCNSQMLTVYVVSNYINERWTYIHLYLCVMCIKYWDNRENIPLKFPPPPSSPSPIPHTSDWGNYNLLLTAARWEWNRTSGGGWEGGRTSEGDQQERGIKRSRGSRGRGINMRGVSRGVEDQEEGGSTGEGYCWALNSYNVNP